MGDGARVSPAADKIYKSVIAAMQEAEELPASLTDADYVMLMRAIRDAAQKCMWAARERLLKGEGG
jgi:hypothetical protein